MRALYWPEAKTWFRLTLGGSFMGIYLWLAVSTEREGKNWVPEETADWKADIHAGPYICGDAQHVSIRINKQPKLRL